MVETHKRKKIEIVIEAALLRRVTERLERRGVAAYTVVQGLEGRGTAGAWNEDQLTGAFQKLIVIAITREEKVAGVLEDLSAFFASYPGIVCVSDVEVIRGERF